MKVNTKIRYGLRTLIELRSHENDNPVLQREIAESQDISEKYLDHIISGLKIAGLIHRAGPHTRGYRLAKKADAITVYDVFRAFDPSIIDVSCLQDEPCSRMAVCTTRGFWLDFDEHIVSYLKSVSVEDLFQKSKLESGHLAQGNCEVAYDWYI